MQVMQCTCGPDSPDDPCGPDGPDGNDGLGGTDGPGEGTLVRGPTCQGLLGLVSIQLRPQLMGPFGLWQCSRYYFKICICLVFLFVFIFVYSCIKNILIK